MLAKNTCVVLVLGIEALQLFFLSSSVHTAEGSEYKGSSHVAIKGNMLLMPQYLVDLCQPAPYFNAPPFSACA